jgi:SAM-dependent methyltransferase
MEHISIEQVSNEYLEDLAEFLKLPIEQVRENAAKFDNGQLLEEWNKFGLNIYTQSTNYLYDLWRNVSNEGYKRITEPLLLLHGLDILDFGGGGGSLSLILANKNNVTYYDLPGTTTDFAKFRASKRHKNIKFINDLNVESNYDLVVANEVMEHVTDIDAAVSKIAKALRDSGSFYYKNSFGYISAYPMHFDYSAIWKQALLKHKLYPIHGNLSVKNGYQTKLQSLRNKHNAISSWEGILNTDSEDELVKVESILLKTDYEALLDLYIDLIKETKWKVVIATPTYDYKVAWGQMVAMSGMVKPPHSFFNINGPLICYNRNLLVQETLLSSDCTHLWFLDSDVVPPSPYGLMRLLQREKDIITGLYARKTVPNQWLMWIKDNPVNISNPETPFEIFPEYRDKVTEITGAGAGCLLIKREVFEKVPPPWFKVDYTEGTTEAWGEDVYFFNKTRKYGIKSFIDTSVICQHYLNNISYPIAAQGS